MTSVANIFWSHGISNSIFYDKLKHANVTPVYKNDDATN